jgi:hypothetical protein
MASISVEVTGAFVRTDLSCPVSDSMRQLIAEEAERWRESNESKKDSGSPSIFGRLVHGVASMLHRR